MLYRKTRVCALCNALPCYVQREFDFHNFCLESDAMHFLTKIEEFGILVRKSTKLQIHIVFLCL